MRRALLLVALTVVATALATPVVGQSSPTVGVDAPDSVQEGSTASGALTFAAVSDTDGVGSYTVEITYDPAVVSVSASGTETFDVATDRPSSGVLRVTGYTGQYPGPTDSGTLADLQFTGESAASSAPINVTVETISDADGDALAGAPVATANDTMAVRADTGGGTGGTGGGGGGGVGGGGGGGGGAPATGGGGTANISVSSASLGQSTAAPGESVEVTATIENTGDATGQYEARLLVDGEFSGEARIVEVAGGAQQEVSFTVSFDETGSYDVAVDDRSAGTLTVEGTAVPTEPPTTEPPATTEPPEPPATTEPTGGTPTDSTGGVQPGFGLVTAVLALLAAVVLFRRR